ncbi:aminoglycoside phosphotransferase family protein [Streptomyces sp. Je 1-79]|uniref:aminoglycoside phosphotransferase family protein n=1 Tax=Streptomyces sp. Je 1-79 TaxID=2943847 RepID=UPI0021A72045|nr:aminoglycoside phosphotransferase family protein [Streptomyces sp. Je 1-79]MCT4357112.1 aminoglycoside phosphotransferase family protein [Streptomyces sp. Je 1-79]
MLDSPLPADLRQWVTYRLPGLERVLDVSWSRGDSRVWRVSSGTGAAYVKLSPTPEDFARELHGYEHAARSLAEGEAPRLLAADPALRALMTTPLPGHIVRGLPLTAAAEARVHELAGRLLRRWHDHPVPCPDGARDGVTASVAAQVDEAAVCLERTGEHLDDAQRALVRQVCRELPALAEDLPLVFRHGDYSTRNWLWDAGHGTHSLIDFEKSGHGIAVEDLVWLCCAAWPTRPELEPAFLAGYGRELSDTERRALPLFAARLGVAHLNAGIAKQEPVLVDRGRTILTRMVHAAG